MEVTLVSSSSTFSFCDIANFSEMSLQGHFLTSPTTSPRQTKNVPDRLKNVLFAEQGAFETIRETFTRVPRGRKCTTYVTSHDLSFIDMSLPPISRTCGSPFFDEQGARSRGIMEDKPLGRRQVFHDGGLVVWPPLNSHRSRPGQTRLQGGFRDCREEWNLSRNWQRKGWFQNRPGIHHPEKHFTPKITLEMCANICDIFKQENGGAPTLDFEDRLLPVLERLEKADDDSRKKLSFTNRRSWVWRQIKLSCVSFTIKPFHVGIIYWKQLPITSLSNDLCHLLSHKVAKK